MNIMDILLNDPHFQPWKTRFESPKTKKSFIISDIDSEGVSLIIGSKKSNVRISAECLNKLPAFLCGKNWVNLTSNHEKESNNALEGHIKKYTNGVSAAEYVATILESAGVISIDRKDPIKVMMICIE